MSSKKKMTVEEVADEARRAWSLDQVKSFVRILRKDVGSAWEWMTPRVREALVAQSAFVVVRSQSVVTVSVDAMNQFYLDMLAEAGLGEP